MSHHDNGSHEKGILTVLCRRISRHYLISSITCPTGDHDGSASIFFQVMEAQSDSVGRSLQVHIEDSQVQRQRPPSLIDSNIEELTTGLGNPSIQPGDGLYAGAKPRGTAGVTWKLGTIPAHTAKVRQVYMATMKPSVAELVQARVDERGKFRCVPHFTMLPRGFKSARMRKTTGGKGRIRQLPEQPVILLPRERDGLRRARIT